MILFTGGSGRIGKLLRPFFPEELFPTHSQFNILDPNDVYVYNMRPKLIVHLAALVGERICTEEPLRAWELNVGGTRNLLRYGIPVLYASTNYVFSGRRGLYRPSDVPDSATHYGKTKAIAESLVLAAGGKVVRFSCVPSPFPHNKACVDMITTAGYAGEIASLLAHTIRWYAINMAIVHLCCKRQSMFDLARQTKPDVLPTTISELNDYVPRDGSLVCD